MLIVWPDIPQRPQNLSAPSQKFQISIKKASLGIRSPWARVRGPRAEFGDLAQWPKLEVKALKLYVIQEIILNSKNFYATFRVV